MELVKAEILFSRKCNLRCSHCKMATNEKNLLSVEEWKKGFDNLKKLGCGFAAFYGAEPFLEFNKLKQVLPYSESIGIPTTVITSGTRIPDFHKKLKDLYEAGGKSLSMSFDPGHYDSSSKAKSEAAIHSLKYWKTFPNIRDAAAIVTLTAKNFHLLPMTIQMMSEFGIWTFFDLIHEDRNQPGGKCSGRAGDLMFTKRHTEVLFNMFELISNMKKNGFLIHNSDTFFEVVRDNYQRTGNLYRWSCVDSWMCKESTFPSWLTIDYDGTVLPCDDFHVNRDFKFNNDLSTWWPQCVDIFKKEIRKHDCNCAWNTHIGAHMIKMGKDSHSDYVHGENNG